MEVTRETNFCRVFELPMFFPTSFCFGGGHDVTFKMVDWFYPIPEEDVINNDIKPWEKYVELLTDFIKHKQYIRSGYKYIVITDFGKSFIFNSDK